MIYWEKLRTEIGRYADGVHELGAPAAKAALDGAEARLGRKLSPALAELYRSFDGMRLYTDSFVILPAAELSSSERGLVRLGEALGAPLMVDERGAVYEVDEAGDLLLCGSNLALFLDAVMAREKLVVDRDGEFKDVFAPGGELEDEVRHKRARAGLKVDPQSAAWRLEAAELAFEAGREAEAQAELERAVAVDPRAGAAWALLGGLHQRAGRLPEAAAAFAKAAESSSDGGRRAERFAEAARAAAGDEAVAAGYAERSLQADAAAAATWIVEAQERLEEGDADGALHLAALAAAVEPDGAAAELVRRARVKSKLKVF